MTLYHPKQDITNGSWHAARPIPGTEMWHSEVECLTKSAAQRACADLNAQALHVQRAIGDMNEPGLID